MRKSVICTLVLALAACTEAPPPEPPAMSLHEAAIKNDIEVVEQHIAAGTDLDAVDAYGSTALLTAATFGATEAALALVEGGADLHVRNSDGGTALHAAAFLCRTEIVEALLEKGANKYLRDNFGSTPLMSVSAPFQIVEPIYDSFAQALAPLGLELDYERLRATRPVIAELLGTTSAELEAVDYTPQPGGGWPVSTPEEQGLDPMLLADAYLHATGVSTLYSLLVIRNGHLIGEGYFNEGSMDQLSGRQSATKSFTSAMIGIALDKGCLSSVDQRMVEFFPELEGQFDDPRKLQITIRDLLQMRAGYPWEERGSEYMDTLFFADNWHWIPHITDIPLVADPGTEFNYSNLTSHILAIIAARACDTDLQAFAQEHLFTPMGAVVADWSKDADGYAFGWGEIYVTARDMAKFGLLYMRDGVFDGNRVISPDWVNASLQRYSDGILDVNGTTSTYGRYLTNIGYGYQWWSATAGNHQFDYAAGHGGQLIVLLHDLDVIIVTTADPIYELPASDGWIYEGSVVDLVGKLIASLPGA